MSTTTTAAGLESLDIVTLVVDDQEEALEFYTETLGFETREDEIFEMGEHEGRWLTVGLPGQDLVVSLTPADAPYYDEETREAMQSKHGTTTWWTFGTEDVEATVSALEDAGVEITEGPTEYPWGTEVMFADPFGNEFSAFEYAEA